MNRGILALAGVLLLAAGLAAWQIISGAPVLFGDVSGPTPTMQAVFESPTAEPTHSVPERDVPGEDFDDLPRYPGSVRVLYRQATGDDLVAIRVEYLTADDIEDVHAHFRRVIDDHAWQLADLEFGPDQRYFFIVRRPMEVSLNLSRSSGQTAILVSYSAPLEAPATYTATPATPTAPATSTPPPTVTPQPTATTTPIPEPDPTSTPTSQPAPPEPPPPPPPVVDDDDDDDDFDDDDDDDDFDDDDDD